MPNQTSDPNLEPLLEYLNQSRGFDFSGYKPNSLQRRIQKRMQMVSIENYVDYIDYLEVHPDEFNQLFNTILINVTSFFRDTQAWDCLKQEIIPNIIQSKKPGQPIRVWSAGCASGEEAYSLAILFAEALGENEYRQRVKIYATDVDEEALAQARAARYRLEDLEPIEASLQEKYFQSSSGSFIFRPELRRQVIFGRHDLVQDAPISRLDLLSCRNTLMYLNAETQSQILSRFHFALRDTGYLFLGKAEMILTRTNVFIPKELTHRIFTKARILPQRDRFPAPLHPGDGTLDPALGPQMALWEGAFNSIGLAAIIIDRPGSLIMANTAAQNMFGIDQRDLGRPLQDLELSYRPVDLRSLIDQVYKSNQTVIRPNVERPQIGGGVQVLDIKVVPLPQEGQNPLGVGITFDDVTRFHKTQLELQRTLQEFETTTEELQSGNEELETTNEELQSTNEELETTNEELQSTNEELETMNEELQSTNEELETLNTELNERTEALDNANALLNAILVSMDAGVVVIDRNYTVLSWNKAATELWGLREDEARGQSFFGLDIGLPLEQLQKTIQSALKRDAAHPMATLEAVNRRGRQITCGVRCTSLKKPGGEIIGVILTMEVQEGDSVALGNN